MSRARGIAVLTLVLALAVLPLFGCHKVTDTEVAVAENALTGAVKDRPFGQGLRFAPLTRFTVYSTRQIPFPEEGASEVLTALTSDQLEVGVDAAFQYQITPAKVVALYRAFGGPDDVHAYVYNTYRSAGRDAVAEISAQELLSTERNRIGDRIEELMNQRLDTTGIALTNFFVRGIKPPTAIREAIEAKLAREQQVQAEQFQTAVIREQANQRREEASGIRDAQQIIAESLSEQYLRYEVTKALRAAAEGPGNLVIGVPGANVLLNPNN